ncbi:MAG: hypothetical protein Q4G08_11435 [Capnocytophaga sp.]|nr:hypothetical protein [Capnocytophaga sp.]MDO5609054.1 hypothetical protein [Capnocytophaga sp.]
MGFFNSLKRQLGRDTGRAISNFVFKDRHVTKYQRVPYNKSERSTYGEQKQQPTFVQRFFSEEKQVDFQKEVDKIISLKFSQKKESIVEVLSQITLLLHSNSLTDILDENENKRYSEILLKKYEHALLALKANHPKAVELPAFEAQYKKSKRKVLLRNYGYYILLVILITFLGIMASMEN